MELITPGVGLIFWQAVTFIVVLLLLSKFAWKPIMSSLKARERSIEDALKAADDARDEMEKLKADNETLIKEAKEERDKIVAEAMEAAKQMKEEAKEEASKEADQLLSEARTIINNEKQAALNELKSQVASMSVQIAEKLIRKELDDKNKQSEVVDQFVKDLNLN